MSFFDFLKMLKVERKTNELYHLLCEEKYSNYPFQTENLDEGMVLVSEVIMQHWKPRYLLDHNMQRAYEFMSNDECLQTVKQEDIAWEKLASLPLNAINIAKERLAHYPTSIGHFKNGVAEVRWELNPDGYYFMDEDGFGMTDDEEIAVYGFIDKTASVVIKFQPVDNSQKWIAMRKLAEKRVCSKEYELLNVKWIWKE